MRLRHTTAARLRAFFCAETDPINLAVFRIVMFAWLLWLVARIDFLHYARLPETARVAPPGYSAFFHLIPWGEVWVKGVHAVALMAFACAAIGYATRAAALVACLCLLYLFGLPQFFGSINHTTHHLIWFSALLAASRSGDALSIDAARAARARGASGLVIASAGPSVAYALPLRFVWLLIGVSYFFPGLAKLRAGPEWFLGDTVRNLMYEYWSSKNFLPPLRIDRYPLLYRAAGAATVALEVGFLPALFFPRLRRLAVAGGIAFHVMNAVYLRIYFHSLLLCYVAFVDWATILERAGRLLPKLALLDAARRRPQSPTAASIGLVAITGSLLLAANVYCGVRDIDSWPFAVYPKFARIRNDAARTSIEVVIREPTGATKPVALALPESMQRLSEGRSAEHRAALRDFLVRSHVKLMLGESLQILKVRRSIRPEDRLREPLSQEVLSELGSAENR